MARVGPHTRTSPRDSEAGLCRVTPKWLHQTHKGILELPWLWVLSAPQSLSAGRVGIGRGGGQQRNGEV